MGQTVSTPSRHAPLVRDFIEHSADRLPKKTALVCDGKRLTYREADRMADQVAQALISLGVWLIAYLIFFGMPHLTVFLLPLIILPLLLLCASYFWAVSG